MKGKNSKNKEKNLQLQIKQCKNIMKKKRQNKNIEIELEKRYSKKKELCTAVPMKSKENKKRDKFSDISKERENLWILKFDGVINCYGCA